jgi:nucleoside 2-deoxyribosyltransferase
MVLMEKKKIYLAGPDVFRPNALEIGAKLVQRCAEAGFEAWFPLDNDISGTSNRFELGKEIALANMQMIRDCDIVLANVEPFRGPSADIGTVYECAFAKALGKYVVTYGLMSDYQERVIGQVPHDGMSVEDWGVWDNIMLVHGTDCHCSSIISALLYLQGHFEKPFKASCKELF